MMTLMENNAVEQQQQQQQQQEQQMRNNLMMDEGSSPVNTSGCSSGSVSSSNNGINTKIEITDANNNVNFNNVNTNSSNNNNNSINSSNSDESLSNSNINNNNNNNNSSDMMDGNFDFSNKTNLIVNYLPQNMTQDEIKALFSSIGPVDSCKLIKDKISGQSLGYAFVNFVKQEDADKAISTLNGMRLQNKTIKVSFARPSSDSIKGANLYVCGLHKDFAQADLEKMFNQFGTIISSKILTDPKAAGASKGVGFVRFDQRIEAEMAIAKLNGKVYENLGDPLVVKFANTPTSVKSIMSGGHFNGANGLMGGNHVNNGQHHNGHHHHSHHNHHNHHQGGHHANGPHNHHHHNNHHNPHQLPLAPFVPTCRGFYQPYRSSANASYRYSPMSNGAITPYINDTLGAVNNNNSLLQQQQQPHQTMQGQLQLTHPQQQQQLHHHHHHHQQQQPPNGTSMPTTPVGVPPTLVAAATAAATNVQVKMEGTTVPPQGTTNPAGVNAASIVQTSLSNTSLSSINYSGWCIFVYNLGPDTDESLLWQLFGPFGAVQSVKIIRDMQAQKCKGFGFVTMTNYEEAVTAINCLNGLNLQNRILQVSFKTQNKQMF